MIISIVLLHLTEMNARARIQSIKWEMWIQQLQIMKPKLRFKQVNTFNYDTTKSKLQMKMEFSNFFPFLPLSVENISQ